MLESTSAFLRAAFLPASFMRCDLAVKNPVSHFSSRKKVAAFPPPFLHSLLASVQAALRRRRRRRHCRLADDDDYDKITFLFLAPAAESKSNFAPSFPPSFLSLFLYVFPSKRQKCTKVNGILRQRLLAPSFSILLPRMQQQHHFAQLHELKSFQNFTSC